MGWMNENNNKCLNNSKSLPWMKDEKMIKRGSILIMSEYTFQDIYISETEKIEDF